LNNHPTIYYHKVNAVNVPLHSMVVTQHGLFIVNHLHKKTLEAQPLVYGKQSLNMQTIMVLVALTAVQSPPLVDVVTASKTKH